MILRNMLFQGAALHAGCGKREIAANYRRCYLLVIIILLSVM